MNDIEYMRNLIASMVSDARRRKGGVGDGEFLLPGFNIPKGAWMLSYIFFYNCKMRNYIEKHDLDFKHGMSTISLSDCKTFSLIFGIIFNHN